LLLQAADTEIGADPAEARRHVGLAAQTAREGLAEARAMVAALAPRAPGGGPSEATVKTHLLRAFGKLGVSDRTAAVTTAIEGATSRRPAGDQAVRNSHIPTGLLGYYCYWILDQQ
jgi:histidine kinase